jgi:hypothetical protein
MQPKGPANKQTNEQTNKQTHKHTKKQTNKKNRTIDIAESQRSQPKTQANNHIRKQRNKHNYINTYTHTRTINNWDEAPCLVVRPCVEER